MRCDPAAIIQAAKDAGVKIDAPVVKIEEGKGIGTYVLILYNGKRLDFTLPQDDRTGGSEAPLAKPPAGRRGRKGR